MRKRRTKYTWLPTRAELQSTGEEQYYVAGLPISIAGGPTPAVELYTINPADAPSEDVVHEGGYTMADVIGSEYFLKRIVGKLFLSVEPVALEETTPAVLVSAGFFVARADGDTPGLPIGGTSGNDPTSIFSSYSPQASETVREPWIWRRSWILGNPSNPNDSGYERYPQNTALYGSVADGPHIDAKTARRITQDDRLFLAVGAVGYPLDVEAFGINVTGWLDYRLLGAARKPRQSGRF